MDIFYGFVVLLCCIVLVWVALEALASYWNKKTRR